MTKFKPLPPDAQAYIADIYGLVAVRQSNSETKDQCHNTEDWIEKKAERNLQRYAKSRIREYLAVDQKQMKGSPLL